jgi:hypothetical protein
MAVKRENDAIQYIKNPEEKVKLAAVKQNGNAIQYIKPTDDDSWLRIQLVAVQQHGWAIRFIKNPKEEVQLAAVRQTGYAIHFIIKNGITPSEDVQIAAVKGGYPISDLIKNGITPSEEVKRAADEIIINEGYKEANTEFTTASNDKSEVDKVIAQYRELVDRNQIKGDEKNIDWWRKQGWNKFKEFVSSKSTEKSITQVKRSKNTGDSHTIAENDTWLIVVPLDKDASCFHGKNTNWCTTKPFQPDFEKYFYDDEATLIYCLNKKTGDKWAISGHSFFLVGNRFHTNAEYFDKNDKKMTKEQFDSQTGLNSDDLIKKAHGTEIDTKAQINREKYKAAIRKIKEFLNTKPKERNSEIEKLLFYTKSNLIFNYMEKIGPRDDYPIQLQLIAVKQNGDAIQFIENPKEAVQLAAVKQDGYAIQYIKPTDDDSWLRVQLAAVQKDGWAINYIKNPKEEVQLAAVRQTGSAIRFIIKNGITPSEDVQIAAVKGGYPINDLTKNGITPSAAVRRAADEIIINEGYKEANTEFTTASNDKAEVDKIIAQYRELVDRNQVKGDEKNIDWWRKQGWDKFKEFVSSKSTEKSITQVKRSKNEGDSHTIAENGTWLIVVPLDKDASCFHGKNTDWCTAKPFASFFEKYFYKDEVTLIYCLNKKTGDKWAIAGHKKLEGEAEYFDKNDKSLTKEQFDTQTGLNSDDLIKKALGTEIDTKAQINREKYKAAISKIKEFLKSKPTERNEEIEKLLFYTKSELVINYMREIGKRDDYPIPLQMMAVNQHGYVIRYIVNPKESVQLAAVNQKVNAIQFIENPKESVQLAAVQQNGWAIEYIENPEEPVQLAAVQQNGWAIAYIENPEEPVQLAAVQQDGRAIHFIIKNGITPSEDVQIAAVKGRYPINDLTKNGITPSEAVRRAADANR